MRKSLKSLRLVGSAFEELSKAIAGEKCDVYEVQQIASPDLRLQKLHSAGEVDEELLKVFRFTYDMS